MKYSRLLETSGGFCGKGITRMHKVMNFFKLFFEQGCIGQKGYLYSNSRIGWFLHAHNVSFLETPSENYRNFDLFLPLTQFTHRENHSWESLKKNNMTNYRNSSLDSNHSQMRREETRKNAALGSLFLLVFIARQANIHKEDTFTF